MPTPKLTTPKYKPLENYGVIGNLHTVALVGTDGSIDWCCMPHFDSPSVFGSLLDTNKGGYFKITALGITRNKQFYLPDSNILLTRFLNPGGAGEVMDFMPIGKNPHEDTRSHCLYRMVRSVRGRVRFSLECFPAFNYGRDKHHIVRYKSGVSFQSDSLQLGVDSPVPLVITNQGVRSEFTLEEGSSLTFILFSVKSAWLPEERLSMPSGLVAFRETNQFWHDWVSQMRYKGRWREMVTRSALVLKLLTFAPSGAIVAAPTTSLPEALGKGHRNWDYRFTWIRDASFTLYGLLRLGFTEEAQSFMGWLGKRLKEIGPDGSLQSVYGIQGEHRLTERTLDHLAGYQNIAPVRVGNKAYVQGQLDIYGELLDAVYLYDKYGSPISYELWVQLSHLLNFVCQNWRKKDKGIWEVRGKPQHFVYSKVMCWVALDRGLRLAQKRSLPADWRLWSRNRDAIFENVMRNGWDSRQRSFVQHYGTSATDASTLVLPLVKFISPTDPRMISTLARIKETLVSDSLVHRYQIGKGLGDGLSGAEGTFSLCTFWYAEVLARSGQVEEARWIFEKMLGYSNHLGLFSEEVGPGGEQLGNLPQALTHLALISSAYNIDKALGEAR